LDLSSISRPAIAIDARAGRSSKHFGGEGGRLKTIAVAQGIVTAKIYLKHPRLPLAEAAAWEDPRARQNRSRIGLLTAEYRVIYSFSMSKPASWPLT
jgi:hypothetical protein